MSFIPGFAMGLGFAGDLSGATFIGASNNTSRSQNPSMSTPIIGWGLTNSDVLIAPMIAGDNGLDAGADFDQTPSIAIVSGSNFEGGLFQNPAAVTVVSGQDAGSGGGWMFACAYRNTQIEEYDSISGGAGGGGGGSFTGPAVSPDSIISTVVSIVFDCANTDSSVATITNDQGMTLRYSGANETHRIFVYDKPGVQGLSQSGVTIAKSDVAKGALTLVLSAAGGAGGE